MADLVESWIRIVRVAERVSRSVIARMASDDLSGPQQRVLEYLLEQPERTDRQIGQRLAMRSSQLSVLMKAMAEHGWVQSVRSPARKNQWLRSLTESGTAQTIRVTDLRRRAYAAAIGELSTSEQRAIDAASQQLFPPPASQPGDIEVVTAKSLIPMLRVASGVARGLGWTVEGLVYVARRITIHFERSQHGYETGWIVRSGENIVGVCLMTPGREFTDQTEDDGHATISLLHVNSQFRGQGHGLRLVDRCIEQARLTTYESLTVNVPKDAKALIRLLKKRKFKKRLGGDDLSPLTMYGGPVYWVHMDLRL